jgi:hypothetical protein
MITYDEVNSAQNNWYDAKNALEQRQDNTNIEQLTSEEETTFNTYHNLHADYYQQEREQFVRDYPLYSQAQEY